VTRLVENNLERDREMEALNAEIQHRRDMERTHGPGNHARDPYRDWSLKKLRKRFNDLRGTSGTWGKRRRNVERFGYDVKHGAHVVRLQRMGAEFLRTGRFNVDRTGMDARSSSRPSSAVGGRWSGYRQRASASSRRRRAPWRLLRFPSVRTATERRPCWLAC
jgi:hypothetical protein